MDKLKRDNSNHSLKTSKADSLLTGSVAKSWGAVGGKTASPYSVEFVRGSTSHNNRIGWSYAAATGPHDKPTLWIKTLSDTQ